NGVRLSNQVANIAIRDGKIISFGSSIVSPANSLTEPVIDPPKVTVDAAQAVANAERVLGLKKNDIEPYLRYTETAEAKYKYVWCFQVRNEVEDPNFQWFEVDVAADSGEIAATYSWVAHAAQYSAVDFRSKDPNPDDHLITHGDLSLKNASPNGWHDNNKQTSGNNVISFRKQGSERLLVKGKGAEGDQYVAPYDRTQSPKTPEHQDLAVINNFVTVNRIHDLLYQYGFTEDAGNFQIDNFGKGGKGGDAVTVSAQDPAGVNNADFTTPPDGQAGVMRMYIFTSTNPNRDASLSNDVTIHEYVHGLSNRLTGGPANSNCLQTLQSRGMGEGWGDTVAIFVQRDATQTRNDDATVGSWVTNNRNGIRAKPYSTDFSRNDLKYANIASMTSVHQVGTVWATMWNEVFWNLVDQAGLAEDIFNAQQEKGNVIALQLLVDGLALQPCNPTFVQARDAVLQAEQTRYGGKYKCAIIKGFAKRGLGMRATSTPANDETVPPEC
ncbi:Fungalysin metallopeptidase-domain-containing protein, partial [Gaertneriomyces semiglobifer]